MATDLFIQIGSQPECPSGLLPVQDQQGRWHCVPCRRWAMPQDNGKIARCAEYGDIGGTGLSGLLTGNIATYLLIGAAAFFVLRAMK